MTDQTTGQETDELLDLLKPCFWKRRIFIINNRNAIRTDIPLNEWDFAHGIFYDERIAIYHPLSCNYVDLFDKEKISN